MMLPFAIAGAGSFRSTGLSRHSQTHLELIRDSLGLAVVQTEKTDDGAIIRFGKT